MYSASDYRSMARRALKNYWWLAVGVTLLASILGGTSSGFTPSFNITVNGDDLTQYYPEALRHALRVFLPISGIVSLAQFVIGGSVSIGHNRFCLKLVDGEEARFEDLFSGFDIFGNAFVLNLLITLKVLAWSLLFVIPGIVAAYRYSMATYIMAENPGMQATDAIERSKALMDGRKGDLFCLDLSFIGWGLLAILTAGIGNLWLMPYMTVSRAAFYRSLPRSMGDRAPNGWQPNPGPQPGGDWYSQNLTQIDRSPADAAGDRSACQKKPRRESEIIFSGGVYGGENTSRLANVRVVRRRCAARAMQRAAAPSNESPTQWVSLERVSKKDF